MGLLGVDNYDVAKTEGVKVQHGPERYVSYFIMSSLLY